MKFIASLSMKKYRDEEKCFVAEGTKLVLDLKEAGLSLLYLFCTQNWLSENSISSSIEYTICSEEEMKRLSALPSTPPVLAVFRQAVLIKDQSEWANELILFLDGIQDPGNMGTILRTADWFGVKYIFCTKLCADIYNAKVVQASMGAIGRVGVEYVDNRSFLGSVPKDVPVYGTFLDGDSIYTKALKNSGIIVLGNEGNGISKEVEQFVSERLYIPHYPHNKKNSESLNVGIATGIILSEFRRRIL